MLRIGEFSKVSGLSPDALYHYERKGILVPALVDQGTGYRFYDVSQLKTVGQILAFKDAGFTLEEIMALFAKELPVPELICQLEAKALVMEQALKQESERLERLHTQIFLMKNGGIPYMSEISIKKVEPILIASIRRAVAKEAFDDNLEEMWPQVNDYIAKKELPRATPCLMLYHSGWWHMQQFGIPYDEKQLDLEVAEPVLRSVEGDAVVKVYPLPAVEKMACLIHRGAFSAMGETFEGLFAWMRQNQYHANGPIREIYHKGDWATDNPEEYVTEIQIPIK